MPHGVGALLSQEAAMRTVQDIDGDLARLSPLRDGACTAFADALVRNDIQSMHKWHEAVCVVTKRMDALLDERLGNGD